MHTTDVLEKGTVIMHLHHRKIRNRVMPVAVDYDMQIGEPRYVPARGWAVPCDVVGLGSKKAKCVKVRFHPSVSKLGCSDNSIASAAITDATKYLDVLLEHSEWTRNEVKACDPRVFHLDRITHFLSLRRPVLSVTFRSLDLSWSLHSRPQSKCDELENSISEALYSLRIRSIAANIVAKVQQIGDCDGQDVSVVFEKAELIRPILRLFLPQDCSYLQNGTIEGCWQLTGDGNRIRLSLPRAEVELETLPVKVPAVVNLFVFDRNQIPMIMEACQLRVEELRHRLDGSLAAFQRSASSQDAKHRSLHIVRQNSTEALIEINIPGARARLDRLLAASPLNVICSGGSADCVSDVAASPADSTDSGILVSPPSSPYRNGCHSSLFHQCSDQGCSRIRQRSTSECVGWDGVVLKSILKKPQRTDRFSRSISESHNCHTDLMHLSLLAESATEVEESDNHTDQECPVVVQRKKRVSFSEKVQERRYRSGQCILTAAKRNEKKRAYRKRKEEKRRCLSDSNDDNFAAKENADRHEFDLQEKPGFRSEREDSGFVDDDENECGHDGKKSTFTTNESEMIGSEGVWKKTVGHHTEVVSN